MNIFRPQEAGAAPVTFLRRPDLVTACLILITLAVWVLCHPYRGIVHDNRIYALLAFNYMDPTTFARDIFLAHGSQDSFTIFSPLYAAAISLFGLDWSTRLLVILGQALWLLGAWALVRKLVDPRFTWLALLFLAACPPYYGGKSVFAIGEGFLSPRLYTEALGLLAIAAFLNSRAWLAGALVILGSLLHPLMMAAPAAVILLLAILRNRPWWMPVLVVTAGTLLLLVGMAAIHATGLPFLQAIDPDWRFVIQNRTMQLMVANWSISDWILIACDMMLVCLACVRATPPVRQMLVSTLAIGLASLVTSFVAFDLLGDVMTGRIQIWRAVWLLHVLAPVALALIVQDASTRPGEDRTYILMLAFAYPVVTFLCNAINLPPFGAPIAILLSTFCLRKADTPIVKTPRDRLMIWAGFLLLLVIILGQTAYSLFYEAAPSDPDWLQVALVPALILVAALLVSTRTTHRYIMLAGLAVLSLLIGLRQWDTRSEWRRYMDSTPDIAAELKVPVAPGELVYWPVDVMATWGALGNPSFYSYVQGAGAIFNRDTALAFRRRLDLVSPFEPQSIWKQRLTGRVAGRAGDNGFPAVSLDDLTTLCKQADHPDVVVLAQDIAGAKREIWKPLVPYRWIYARSSSADTGDPQLVDTQASEFYFYRCRDLRQAGPRTGAAPPAHVDESWAMMRANKAPQPGKL